MSEQSAVAVLRLRIDGGTQPRAAISDQTVSEYADLMHAGIVMPPVDVFFDGVDYWLADGFHRYHATQRLGEEYIRATVHTGTRRDAVLFSVGVNQEHGLRRTNDDKRKAVSTLLADDEWAQWSDREISRRCGVSNVFVSDVRRGFRTRSASSGKREDSSLLTANSETERTYTTKHGTEATMRVEKIGRSERTKFVRREFDEADYESRKSAAVDGVSLGVIRRLPKRHDTEIVKNAVLTLRGIVSAFGSVDPAPLSDHPDVEEWRATIAETIGVLRNFNKRLERRAV